MAMVLVAMNVWAEGLDEDDHEAVIALTNEIIASGEESTASSVTIHSVEVQ